MRETLESYAPEWKAGSNYGTAAEGYQPFGFPMNVGGRVWYDGNVYELVDKSGKTNSGGVAPNANLDGERLYLYPPSSTDAFTSAEVESALAAGVTPLIPTDDGQAVQIVRMVTTKTTTNSAIDESEYDLAYSRTQAYMARKIDAAIKAKHKQETRDDKLLLRMRDTVLAEQRLAASFEPPVLVGVEQLKDEVVAVYAGSPVGRVLIDSPFSPAGPHHQTVVSHRQLINLS
jgi:hypothetical protein